MEPVQPITKFPPQRQTSADSAVNLDELELSVRSNLHDIGADLGQDIEISPKPPNRVLVRARHTTRDVRDAIAKLLTDKPGIQLEFDPAGSGSRSGGVITKRIPETEASRPIEPRLANFFGSVAAQEQYTSAALEASNRLLARVYALRELAERWPANQEQLLPSTAKQTLMTIVQDHCRSVVNITGEVTKQFEPLLKHFGYAVSREAPVSSGATWQKASASALEAAQRVDRLIRSLLTTSDTPLSPEEALRSLQQDLGNLERAARELQTAYF
jgi:hypothetical protein